MKPLLDPSLSLKLVIWGGAVLAALGLLKLVVYLIGEFAPGLYARVRNEWVRRFLVGQGNRLLFGLGGAITLLLGLGFITLGLVVQFLVQRASL